MTGLDILDQISEAIVDFDAARAEKLCGEAIAQGIPPYKVITEGLAKGMDVVSKRYEAGEYFLSELIMAGETMKEALRAVEPHLPKGTGETRGTIVVGTIQGDLHDIGKNIFANLARGAGFRVIDLGFDVSPKAFADEVEQSRPDIVGMSALLTTTMANMGETVAELERRGLRSSVHIVIGGASVDQAFAKKIGADRAVKDAVEGVAVCKQMMGG
jgi:5-methyltetrahydrofolate--homocysteine methyltransferase